MATKVPALDPRNPHLALLLIEVATIQQKWSPLWAKVEAQLHSYCFPLLYIGMWKTLSRTSFTKYICRRDTYYKGPWSTIAQSLPTISIIVS
jgi:hypothetical protein